MMKNSNYITSISISFILATSFEAYSQTSTDRFGNISNIEGETKDVATAKTEAKLQEGATFKAIPKPIVSQEPDNRKFRSIGRKRYAEGFGRFSRSKNKIEAVKENVREKAIRSFDLHVSGRAKPDRKFRGKKAVIGRDNRSQLSDTTRYPFRTFGLLEITFDGWDTLASCSATLISESTALTAAHCVYHHEDGGWFDQGVLMPGRTLAKTPFGEFTVIDATAMSGYIDNWIGRYNWDVLPSDLAVIKLSGKPGRRLGVIPFGYFNPAKDFTGNIVGYPGDKEYGSMWLSSCAFNAFDVYKNTAKHYCDTASGSSGSAIYDYEKSDKSRVIIGINAASADDHNLSVYFDQTYFEWICDVVEEYEGRSICG